jgi:VanZ family protein
VTALPRAQPPAFLALQLALAYTLLAGYGSLYPFSGWHDSGAPARLFLSAAWPRYYTAFDLLANTLAYLPLGLFWAAALQARLRPLPAFALASLLGLLFSLSMELIQNYLPSRIPSNLDLACNSLGGILGAAIGLRWGRHLLDGGRLHAWRARRFLRGPSGDTGLLLLALWLLSQLNPETFLFGNGNLRGLLGLPAALPFAADDFLLLESATVAAQTLAIALIGARLAANHPRLLPLALIAAALLVKSLALLVLMQGVQGLAWATPGTLAGLGLGLALWACLLRLPACIQQSMAVLALLLAVTLVNLMPDNPYLEATLRVWQQGHFLNFNGLTRLTTALWPFLALPWLLFSRKNP